eukprot:scaffold1156_cov394-Prasinococcus_capsulatus_cf.AAC.8
MGVLRPLGPTGGLRPRSIGPGRAGVRSKAPIAAAGLTCRFCSGLARPQLTLADGSGARRALRVASAPVRGGVGRTCAARP